MSEIVLMHSETLRKLLQEMTGAILDLLGANTGNIMDERGK